MKSFTLKFVGFASFLVLLQVAALGGPFAEKIPFTQPDGTPLVLWGQGDEFYAVFETLDGYTVVRDPHSGFYCLAEVSPDGETYRSTGVSPRVRSGAALGLRPGARVVLGAKRRLALGPSRHHAGQDPMGNASRGNASRAS